MTAVKTHAADLRIDVRDFGKKIEFLVGGFIIKGGWEIYKEKRRLPLPNGADYKIWSVFSRW